MAEKFSVRDEDLVLDSLPEDVRSSMEVRDKYLNRLGTSNAIGMEFVVSDVLRWTPGQVLRVAFLGGDLALHRDIADALVEISDACSIRFDFGERDESFRTWSEQDQDHAAEIRVSFDKPGYFSLVGTDSINREIGAADGRVGGRPHQCSLNLGGFTVQRPSTWRGTVRHEFLHALGFHHSHQNMRGPCQQAFRWEDDPGYQPTRDSRGSFIQDPAQRRPGIYTYLAGFPNFWSSAKVDHNLKTEDDPNVVAGPFDRASVMLYRFPSHFYRVEPSPCAPSGDGQSLSEGDRRGLALLYPRIENAQPVLARQNQLAAAMVGPDRGAPMIGLEEGPPAAPAARNPLLDGVAAVLRRNLQSASREG